MKSESFLTLHRQQHNCHVIYLKSPKQTRTYPKRVSPHTYVRKPGNDSSAKQTKTNVTHRSRRNKATLVSNRMPSRSLSSLQRWKADPIFTRVFLLAFAVHQCKQTLAGAVQHDNCCVRCMSLLLFCRHFSLLFFIRHLYRSVVARLICHVHWALSPPHHE